MRRPEKWEDCVVLFMGRRYRRFDIYWALNGHKSRLPEFEKQMRLMIRHIEMLTESQVNKDACDLLAKLLLLVGTLHEFALLVMNEYLDRGTQPKVCENHSRCKGSDYLKGMIDNQKCPRCRKAIELQEMVWEIYSSGLLCDPVSGPAEIFSSGSHIYDFWGMDQVFESTGPMWHQPFSGLKETVRLTVCLVEELVTKPEMALDDRAAILRFLMKESLLRMLRGLGHFREWHRRFPGKPYLPCNENKARTTRGRLELEAQKLQLLL